MRSNEKSTGKVYKPPPPVPPRPSKTLIHEALTKTNKLGNETTQSNKIMDRNKTKSPVRQAPPPPPLDGADQVKVMLKKQTNPNYYEGSIAVDKHSSRPVVYLSDNLKRHQTDVPRTNSIVKRNDSSKRTHNNDNSQNKESIIYIGRTSDNIQIRLKRVESFQNNSQRPQVVDKKGPSLILNNCKKVEMESSECLSTKEKDDIMKNNLDSISDNKFSMMHDGSRDDSESRTSTMESGISSKLSDNCDSLRSTKNNSPDEQWSKTLNDRNHVNTLIDEMFASVLEVNSNSDSNRSSLTENIIKDDNENKIIISNTVENSSEDNLTVIVISDENCSSNASTNERKVKFTDQVNHELLISELQNMKNDQEKIMKRQRMPSANLYGDEKVKNDKEKIHTNDWYGVNDGKEVKMSSCHIMIEEEDMRKNNEGFDFDYERIAKMSHLHGLPPLPKSLSGFNFIESHFQGQRQNPATPVRSSSIRSNQGPQITPVHHVSSTYSTQSINDGLTTTTTKTTNLDTQLAILRREMYSLRQQDLSLLSQLWSLNESIQDFRQILQDQDQDDPVLSPPTRSPTPSSADEEDFYMSASSTVYKQSSSLIGRKLSGSSAASGSVG